jgi:hypothetical protein
LKHQKQVKAEAPKAALQQQLTLQEPISSSKKILDEKYSASIHNRNCKDGRITKEDAVNAVPSITLQEEAVVQSVQNYRCCVVK